MRARCRLSFCFSGVRNTLGRRVICDLSTPPSISLSKRLLTVTNWPGNQRVLLGKSTNSNELDCVSRGPDLLEKGFM